MTRFRFGGLRKTTILAACGLMAAMPARAQEPRQPRVAPGPDEPDWVIVLRDRFGLSMFDDLLNPVKTTAAETPGLFRKAGPGKVRYGPVIALGLASRTEGGWYRATGGDAPKKSKLWSYKFKNTAADLKDEVHLPPPLEAGSSLEFDPGDQPFGLWVANEGLSDGGVFTEPAVVARINARLAKQPYKAMIYPHRDKMTGNKTPNSYLIGWEYSTNDDFQDVVCRIDNVVLIAPAADEPEPPKKP